MVNINYLINNLYDLLE
uniref:Uncharacterized protein n=1 Tax=Moumouvirus sp. 'Monve' TaxID=1128131 RepID=H2EET7_9VIRU|nr:hypothetical protein mv_L705 [Moumouvirus Monve]